MSSVICRIQPSASGSQHAVGLSQLLMKEWGCQNGQSIKLRIGSKSMITRVIGLRRKKCVIVLSRSIAAQLNLPFFGETRAAYRNKELRLGPVLAILTTGFSGSGITPFGARSALFRNFLLASREERPFFYVFTPEMVDWTNQVVSGWFYRKDGSGTYRWMRRPAPLPDVVYERVPNRKAEAGTPVKNCKARLQAIGKTRIFNQGFFNKWQVHEALYNHPLTLESIPEAHRSPTVETIRDMLERYKMVYLKPSGGSLGLGISRITQSPDGGYYCRFRNGDQNILRKFRALSPLMKQMFGPQMKRLPSYIVQQGIRLIKYRGSPVDFRVHMHKDRMGMWKVVGLGAKGAGAGCVTTHGRTGGSLLSAQEVLAYCFPGQEKEMEHRIRETSIRICTALENRVGKPLGELGLDIGVDQNRRIWLFEVNAKPGRHIFKHPSLAESGRQSARCITEYCLKLAQF
ncbi:YheC/D-like protein [Melghirimyces profundicolus]|uniref:YheC/D-like protein n=1 Tax=Melghirimyces profundicolus TaxID=1242148 RepID=A0A2T6C4N0_9BACL|nr:YheC/YheD family protein [Melghirimyces profundicolus]PTX63268.1 YheC/D-like protein [Melghirimyces profundicolus]